jgi:hypothetical protein
MLLQQHDPARGAALAAEDRHRIRAAMLGVGDRQSCLSGQARLPVLHRLVATLMALVVLGTITFGVVRRADREAPRPRRVEYKTPGGTRVIWTLDPSFHM